MDNCASKLIRSACILSLASLVNGCGGTTEQRPPDPQPQQITLSISPTSATLATSQTQQFQATVTGSNTAVTWSVDKIAAGNASVGSISSSGLYTAPAAPGNHTVEVTAVADPTQIATATVTIVSPPAVTTERYQSDRTGTNLKENILTPANVKSSTFGKIKSYSLDGVTYTQPLYVPNLSIPGQGTFNVIFVATEHDSVYAFDADGNQSNPLWKVSLIDPSNGITTVPQSDVGSTISPEIGITGTPVIDLSSNTMYLVAFTKENGNYFHRLHALDITTGTEKLGGPVTIQATVPGTGSGTDGNGNVPFQAKIQLQRTSLLLSNGMVYIAWGSHGDNGPYHGWIAVYSASNLSQVAVWNSTPNGKAGAIWQSGDGLSVDSNGTIYAITGNGTFDAGSGGSDFGDSIVALTLTGSTLTVADYFTPFNQAQLSAVDNDLGTSGLTLIPGTRLGTAAGKDGSIYLVNLDNMGKFNSVDNSQIVQYLPHAIGTTPTDDNFSSATFFNGNVYYIGQGDFALQYQLNGGLLSATPVTKSTNQYGHRGAQAVVSANGNTNAIMWAIEYVQGGNAVLHAYDANNLATELYNSTQAGQRDVFGVGARFSLPTVINGKVYVAGKNELAIFGNI